MNLAKLIFVTACLGFGAATLHAADYYVATSGNDSTGNGTIGAPYRTIQKAANTAVAGDNVIIRAGTYRETVRPANSGTAPARITYKAFETAGAFEEVIISGADPVTGWTVHDTSSGRAIYKTSAMNWNLSDTGPSFGTAYRNQIFVNGQMMVLARWPNVPTERITRLTYQDLALVSAASGKTGSTATDAWIENADINSAFPAGYWNATRSATARVFLSPATMIWGMSTKIASQASNRINMDATGTGFSFTSSYYYPTTNNRFFIYDWYEALDTAGEYWKDTATNTLYLWAPDGVNPATLTVEARRRDFGLSLGSRSYLTFQGIKLFACTVDSDASSSALTFSEIEDRYIGHIDNYAPTFTTAANAREFYLRGDGHVVQDSYFFGSAVGVIGASGSNMRIENNVIRDFGYAHNGSAIFGRNGGIFGNRTLATKNQFLHNTAFNSGHTIVTTDPAIDIKYNRIYNSHLRGSDIGAVGIASTDGLGSEISYNVISDALGPKDTGVLYGGFGIYFDYECRNYTVHHNIVYNTTGGSYQLMPIRGAQLPGVVNVGMKFYHNSGDKDFGIIEPQDIPGVDVRNNLIRKFGSAGGNYNGLPNVQFSNNTAYTTDAGAPFRDRLKGDLRFATGSSTGINAGTVISPYSDGFVGAAPDTGALEFDQAAFIAGATVTQRQLATLTATTTGQTGNSVDLQLGNLPEGRSPASNFQVQIGSGPFGGSLAYDYATATWSVLSADKGALTGLQSVSVRLGSSGVPVTLASQIDVGGGLPGPEIALRGNDVNISDGDTTPSGIDHTIFPDTQAGGTVGTTQSFTIYNYGSLPLTLGAVTFTGTHAADFSVLSPPAATLAPGASTTFVVRFLPAASGLRSATLHLANNDADEGDFNFAVQGQSFAPQPVLNLPAPQLSSSLTTNSSDSVELSIQNIGLANLTWSLASSSGNGIYTWADSNSGGPAFNWYNIQTLGTKHWGGGYDDDVSTVVNLPFTFPYYGNNFTQLTLSTNGILFPGSVSGLPLLYNNLSLPTASAPVNLIAPFWDDLLVDASAQIRSYAADASTFVVLYENVKSFSSVNRITFQVVFRSNGQITVQYQDNQFTRSYTIGLQNAARTLGPQVAYSDNNSALQGLQLPVGTSINRAITFYPPSSFVTGLSPASGTVTPGSGGSTSVNLSSSGLALGTYQTTLTLTSNDPNQASVQIPLTLQVVAAILPPLITPDQSANGVVGYAFSYQLTTSNGPTSYALASGDLPSGVTLNTATGLLSGTPASACTFTPGFTATNSLGTSEITTATLSIAALLPPFITASQSASGVVGSVLSYQITASNSPTSYALASGDLPSGVTLNTATGLLSGTPASAGTFTPVITATNGGGTSPAVTITLNIAALPVGSLIVYESFNYTIGSNAPDPDGGLNSNNGLPATNSGGTPSGTSTGLYNTWGPTLNVATGLAYTQNTKTLVTTGGSGTPNNATWGGSQLVYRNMSTDPFLAQRIGGVNNGSFGVDGSTLYLSVLARTTSATANAWRLNLGGSLRNVFLENTATGWSLDENAAGPVATTGTLALNTTTLLVVRIDFVAGAGDVFRLYVNPPLGGTLGTANATLTTSVDFGGFNSPNPRPNVLNAMTFDEIRLGTSLASVSPYTEAPPVPTLLTYEGFNYPSSAAITNQTGGTGWRSPTNPSWTSGGTTGTVAASGLSYTAINPSYTAFASSGLAGNYSGALQNSRILAIDTGGVYAAAGLKASDGNYLGGSTVNGILWGSYLVGASVWSSPQMLFNLGSTAGTGTQASIRQTGAGSPVSLTDTSGGSIGATGAILTSSLSTTTPNLIVFRYVFNGAGNDTLDVWLNPTSASDIASLSATAADFILNQPTLRSVNANGNLVFDEIRFGTTFADVAPYSLAPPAPVVTASQAASGTAGSAFSYQVAASNTPTSYALSSGSLPGGVTLNTTTGLLSGTPSASGAFTPSFTATNAGGTSPAVAVTLTIISAPTGLANFRTSNGLATDGSQDLLTPAGDGVANLLKYAFNMVGSGSGQAPTLTTPNAAILDAAGTAGLPVGSIGTGLDSGKLQITYIRRKPTASPSPGISYAVEFSDALATWVVNASATESVTSIDSTFERVTVTDSVTAPTERFVHLRVTTH